MESAGVHQRLIIFTIARKNYAVRTVDEVRKSRRTGFYFSIGVEAI